jgi:autotransporter-associated beta strand protein
MSASVPRIPRLSLFAAACLALAPTATRAANLYWDANGGAAGVGGTGAWDGTSAFWSSSVAGLDAAVGTFSDADRAFFAGQAGTVDLVAPVTIGGLVFVGDGFRLTGSALTLASADGQPAPEIFVGRALQAELAVGLAGDDGFTKTGVGTLRLTAAGTYTGLTTIANGTIVLTRGDALGADVSAVSILGSGTRGAPGGQLVLAGGVTFNRALSLQGLGPISDRSGTVVSVGDNTLAGAVAGAVGLMNNRLIADGGLLTLAGSLDIQGTAGTHFVTFGGVNAKGNGNYALTGALTGTASLNKESGGTLLLRPTDTTGFSGVIRTSGGTIRVEDVASVGTRTASGTGGVLDLNGGGMEFRLDAPNFGATRHLYNRGGTTSSVFADRAVGGFSVLNGVVAFGQFAFEENLTFVFGGRNGFGYSFTSAPVQGGTNNSTITSNAPGTVVFNGNTWANSDNAAARTLTINGAGNVTFGGNLVAASAAFDHNLTKAGASLLRIVGTGSTLDGTVSINDGALAITDFRSITNNAGRINIGSTTAQGRLIIGETGANPSAAGLVTNKVVNLAGTTGGAQIFASQPGANPVVFNAAFLATGAGAKTLAFSGTNTAENLVAGAIVENGGAVSLQKNGPGTWALAGANAFTGGTLITNGTLRLKDTFAAGASRNLMPDAGAFTFQGLTATQDAGGVLEYVGAAGAASVERLGALNLTAGAATIRVSAGLSGTAALEFASLATNGNSTLNVITGAGATVKLGTLAGFGAQRIYFNGADIGIFDNGVVRAPLYGTDTDFNAVNVLTTAKHGYLTADASTAAITQKTLKLEGSVTLTLSGTLSMNNGSNANGNILATGGASRITGANVSGPGTANLSVRVNQSSDVLTIDGSLTGFSGGINKNGEGRLVLNGAANAFTGSVNLNEGEIELGAGARLGGDGAATFSPLNLRQWGVLDLGGNTVGFNAFNGSGVVTNGAAGSATFVVGNNAGDGTWTGVFQDGVGVLNVAKTGTAGQNWHGVSTHTGFTRIGGTGLVDVQIMADVGQPSGIGAGSAAANAASLVFNGSTGGLNYSGSSRILALTFGSASVSTDRLFTLAGTGATISSTVSNGNAIVWRNTGDIAFGLVGPQTLTLTGTSTGDNSLFPRLTDSGTGADLTAVTKAGAGVWVLANPANAYTGLTTAANGTLVLAAAGSLPSGSPLVIGDAATVGLVQAEGSFTRALAAAASPGAGTVTWAGTAGGGFAASFSALTVALGGAGAPTPLTWGQGGFVPSGAALHLNSTVALGVVDFRNAIDVDGAARTISVNDNPGTSTDYALLSGVVSNATGSPAGLIKAGAGVLVLAGANTYDGTTTVSAGQLMVTSLGQSGALGASSLGATLGAHLDGSALLLGNAGTTGGIFHYVGQGEVSDRKIRLNTTTGSPEIHASGAGALVLTNVANDLVAGAKILYLRGSNAGGNAVRSVLADNGGALGVQVDGSAAWILDNPLNTFTGTVTVTSGALGVGADAALGSGVLSMGSASVFAVGGDRVLANVPQIVNNMGVAFVGDHAFTFTQPLALRASANTSGLTNNLPTGKPLIFPAVTVNDIDANGRGWNLGGSGDTVITGDITSTKTFSFSINYSGTGSLTLGGTASTTNGGVLNVTNGTLRLGADGVLANLLAGPSLVTPLNLTLNPAVGATATLDLNGRADTLRGLTASAGTAVIANSAAGVAQLTFGAGDQAFALNGAVTNAGAGPLTLRKVGTAAATFGGGSYAHKGGTFAEGGILTFNGPLTGTNALAATDGARLALAGGLTQPALVTAVTVGPGATLSLAGDNAGSELAALTALSLGTGAGTGTATLALNIGDVAAPGDGGNTDTLRLLTGGALALGGTITFNLSDAGLNANQTYTLLTLADGGLSAFGTGNILQGSTPGGFTSFTWDVTDSAVRITSGNLITGVSYWRGLSGTAWNGAANNWSLDKAGTTPAVSIPGQGTDVRFQWDAGSAAAVVTTLEQNFKVNSLVFEAATNPAQTPVSVDIGPGTVVTSRLEIAPQSAADGVALLAGGPAAVTLSAGFKIGAAQTWTVADAASVLSLGALQGAGDVTKSGAGRVVLTAAAEPSFNLAATTDFLITGGDLELRSGTALGSTGLANLATVRVDGGAFYVNAAATTLANPLTLAGGVLSAGTATQTYSGAVSLLAASTVNLRDNASAVLTTAARNVTLTGGVTGSGRLTVDSINTVSNLNQLSGTLSLNNFENSAWTGGLDILRGTVATNRQAGFGTGAIAIAAGKIVWSGANTAVWTVPNDLTIAAAGGAAYGEINVDNASGTVAAPFTVNFTGALTLGGAGGTGEARLYLADAANTVANFTGPITLANNGALNVFAGGSTVTLDAVIGETGGARSLALNPAGWTAATAVLQLRGANTFSGDLSIGAGLTAEFATVSDIGGPASNLGRGAAIALSGGTLVFTGGSSQSTNRGLTSTANATLRVAGASSATMTYAGAFNADGFSVYLTAATAAQQGALTGGLTQTGTGADLYVNSGRWTLGGGLSAIADDVVVTGADARLILAGTGSLAYTVGTSNGLYARNGGTIALASDHVVGANNEGGLDFILLGDTTPGAVGTFEMGGFNLVSPRLDLGNRATGLEGVVTGPGLLTLTTASADWSSGVRLLRGSVAADLAGGASFFKFGPGTVVLSGANAGLTNTTVATRLDEGELRLDFTGSGAAKLPTGANLDLRGGALVLQAGAAPGAQAFAGLVLTQGHSRLDLRAGAGESLLLDLAGITRAANTGTVRLLGPAGGLAAGRGFVTSATNDATGALGAHLTLSLAGSSWFVRNDAGRLAAVASAVSNDVTAWIADAHVTDGVGGFTGQAASVRLASLRFGAASGSVATLAAGSELVLRGGLLVSESVTAGAPALQGGGIRSATGELILTQHSAQPFELGSTILAGTTLTKAGNGVVVLSGANRNGAVQVQSGVLQLAGGSALEDATLVTLAGNQASTLELLASETLGRLAGGNATTDSVFGLVDVGGHALTLRPTANATYSGQIVGTGTIVKNGLAGETTLNGISSGFTGLLRINQAGFTLTGVGAIGATRIEVNGAGFLFINNNGDTRSGTRIPDSTPLVLNSAAGTRVNETLIRGVWLTADRNVTISETIGNLVFGSGTSYISGNASGTTGVAGLIASNFVRQNAATAVVRGRALGATSGDRNVVRIGDAAADAAFVAGLVGGAGTAGTATMSIVPWMVGEALSAAYADANMGNSLMTYVSGQTVRPLNLATEYATYATAGATNNTRESLSANLTTLAGRTVNSLSLHAANTAAATFAFTGAGATQSLTNISGAFLFTLNPAATAGFATRINVGGFDDGLLVGGAEYLFHVQNPSTATGAATLVVGVASPLATAADLTKSGRGTLVLAGVNAAGGGARRTTLNEGVLEIPDLDAIGGDTGSVVFAGGTLRLGTGFADDLFTRSLTLLEGGMGLDTNGVSLTVATGFGTGVGRFSKFGLGDLTLNAPISNGGPVLIAGGKIVFGVPGALASGWDLQLGEGATTGSLDLGLSNHTVTALSALANNPAASVVTIAPGRTLRVEGDVLLANRTDAATTRLSIEGGGDLVVQGASIVVGQNTAGTNFSSSAFLDLSGTASFTAELSNRLVVMLQGDNSNADSGVLTLSAGPNLISAPSILIGAGGGGSSNNALRLGPSTNVLRTDLLNLGSGNRDGGRLEFQPGAGTLSLRNLAGDGRAQISMGNGSAQTTGYITANVIDLEGRVVDLAIGNYRTAPFARSGANNHDFRFDAGVVDILQLNLAVAKGTGVSTSLFRIGGGELRLGGSAAFGDLGTGSVSLGTDGAGELRIDGGLVLASVPLGRSAGSGSGTLTLSGGVLDLGGLDLGSAATPLTLALTAGTLRNYGQLNGGQALVKTGAGTLVLDGSSGHVAGITIDAGVLQVGAGGSTGTLGASDVANAGTLAFDRTGTLVVSGAIIGTGDLRKDGAGTVVLTGASNLGGAAAVRAGVLQLGSGGTSGSLLASGFALDAGATLRFARSDVFDFNSSLTGAVGSVLEQAGSGRARITSANLSFAGDLRVTSGELDAAAIDAVSSARQLIVSAGATLSLTVDAATGYGFGPDLSLEGGLLRFLAGSGDATLASLRDLDLAGGVISSGLAAANVNSMVVKGRIDVSDDTTVSARQVAFISGGTASVATEVAVVAGKTLAFTGTLADDQTAMLPTAFDKRGAGTLVLSGDNARMTGASSVNVGVLDVRHVNALGDGVATNLVTFLPGQTSVFGGSLVSNQANFGAAGAVAGKIIVGPGGAIGVAAPGSAVIGNLAVTNLALQGGGRVDFKFWDRASGLGVGYDQLDLGAVDLRGASSVNRITIKLISMSSANAFGDSTLAKPSSPLNFTSFTIGGYDVANSQLGANVSDLFTFDASQFTYAGGTASDAGLWMVNFNAGAITLTAVPEPSTYGFGLGALALAAAALRRRRQTKKA